jgi:catechol-2,3-dioxygenase
MPPTLSRTLLFVRNLDAAGSFFHSALGLRVLHRSGSWLRLDVGGGAALDLQEIESEAALSVGYSPMLEFQVKDLPELVPRLLMSGATMDGPIRFEAEATVAVVRSPTGHMISLVERSIAVNQKLA